MSQSTAVRTTFDVPDLEIFMKADAVRVAQQVNTQIAEALIVTAATQLLEDAKIGRQVARVLERRMAPISIRAGRIAYPLVRDEGQR